MPIPKPEFDEDDIQAARRKGEQWALQRFQANGKLDLEEEHAMAFSEQLFPNHTERQRKAFGFEIKDAAERLFAKLTDLAS